MEYYNLIHEIKIALSLSKYTRASFLVNNKQTPPIPPFKKDRIVFWSNVLCNDLKRMKNLFSDFCDC